MGPIRKHQKANKFTPVIGGTQIAFRGGWTNGTATVPSLHTASDVFVLADLYGGFGQLVFGRKTTSAELRAKVHCIAGLQAELARNILGSEIPGVTIAKREVEVDLMADATMDRGLDAGRVRMTRAGRRNFLKKKRNCKNEPWKGGRSRCDSRNILGRCLATK